MSSSQIRVLYALIGAIVGAVLGLILFKWVLVVLFAAIVGGALGFMLALLLVSKAQGQKVEALARTALNEVVRPDQQAATERLVYQQLISLNQRIRLTPVSFGVLQTAESLIDLLLRVVPRAYEEANGREATFNLEKLATTHLPGLLDRYRVLSVADQANGEQELVGKLKQLADNVQKMEQALNAGALDQFDTMQAFTDVKFGAV
ncbi:MAG: hypothetical protein V4436_01205 [Patescibacteria group bacterium]